MLDIFRVAFAAILLSVCWMTVFRAPTLALWKLSIGMTEFPFVFCLLNLLVFVPPFEMSLLFFAAATMAIVAFGFFLSPVLRAGPVARALPHDLQKRFGANVNKNWFSLWRIFAGKKNPRVAFETVTYKKYVDGATLTLDLYRAQGGKAAPCVIVVHGGSWAGGNSQQLPKLNYFLTRQGYTIAAINYSLAPDRMFPAPVHDLSDALQFLRDQANEFQIDPENFFFLGRSAGGQIALMEAYRDPKPYVRGVISFYAPADMVWAGEVSVKHRIMDSPKVMKDYLGASFAEDSQRYADASPLVQANAAAPPTLLFHGLRDELVYPHHAEQLEKKLQALGVPSLFVRLPWATHAFDFRLSGPGGQISTAAIEVFLKTFTKKTAAQKVFAQQHEAVHATL